MTDSANGDDLDPARSAFEIYLRTGRRPCDEGTPAETKYNPWHDPEDGRFTHAGSGNYFGAGGASRSSSRRQSVRSPQAAGEGRAQPSRTPTAASAARAAKPVSTVQFPATSLSRTHRAFLSRSQEFPAKPGTQEVWTYAGRDGSLSKLRFKDQFISGHSNVLLAAAKQSDVPAELVASVAYTELGHDDSSNDVAYALRAEGGRSLPALPILGELNKPRDETSFGPYNIQVRRAAEILGYGDINKMSETARRALIPTLRDPVAATFMLAKHLSDLRDLDFPGVAGKDLTKDELLILATRYRLGPDVSMSKVLSNIESGKNYLSNWNRAKILIKK